MSLLNELISCLDRLTHSEASQHDGEAASAEGGYGDGLLDIRELRIRGRWQDSHVMQLGK